MQEHGTFDITLVGQIITVRFYDAWNLETALRCCQEYKTLVKQICHAPWACVVDLRKWELGTPDIWQPIDEVNAWGNLHNQKFETVIANARLQQTLFEKSHQVLTNVETFFCENSDEALVWIASKEFA